MMNIAIFLMVLAVIFGFTSMDGESSSRLSMFLTDFLRDFGLVGIKYSTLHFFVRKCAHMIEFGVLGWATYRMLPKKNNVFKKSMESIFVCFLFAMFDEFRQTMISGRDGCFRDVIIDTCGATIGVAITYFLTRKRSE